MDRLRLAPERVQSVVVEIGRGEFRIPVGRKTPGTIIEAFARHVDIVAVEYAMDKACGEIGSRELCSCSADEVEEPQSVRWFIGRRFFAVQVLKAVADELVDVFGLAKEGKSLERADADVAVAEPRQHGCA